MKPSFILAEFTLLNIGKGFIYLSASYNQMLNIFAKKYAVWTRSYL